MKKDDVKTNRNLSNLKSMLDQPFKPESNLKSVLKKGERLQILPMSKLFTMLPPNLRQEA